MRGGLPIHFGVPMPAGSDIESDSSSLVALARRQLTIRDDEDDIWFWYSTTGVIIKYTLFFTFLLILVGWVVGGRIHAKRRLRKGLKPLSYHAWLLSRQERGQVDPAYAYPPQVAVYGVYRPAYGNNQGGSEYYSMQPMPPPVYDPSRPPMYDGPPAGSKADGQGQPQTQGVAPEYMPPAGPPPGAAGRYS
ncbi:putative ubiquitin-protein ligase sel1 protein [Rosellinia necatrix]|uniref:Putative ubiquitin-protein ligase sel1 protein n=1 Tax=Rosellinia necatrix TaxID=77044 RepID=A0A1W2TKG3_ROSNE|nr:putative ubiquitin-protein ligase sel1 protein [Rosellinia necatrix]